MGSSPDPTNAIKFILNTNERLRWFYVRIGSSIVQAMTDQTTTQKAVNKNLTESTTDFMSEDVYALVEDNFVEVTCEEVYGFSSIASSGDFSETSDTLQDLLQLGVVVRFPNGTREMLVVNPTNMLSHYSKQSRRKIIDSMFNNGRLWISQYDSVFKPAGFPTSWDTLVVPDITSVSNVIKYREDSITDWSPTGKLEVLSMASVLAGFLSWFVLGTSAMLILQIDSPLFAVAGLLVTIAAGNKLIDKAPDFIEKAVSMDVPHISMDRQELDDNALEGATPLASDTMETMNTVICEFDGEWTDVTVKHVDEGKRKTTLRVELSEGQTLTVPCKTPADKSDRFVLNHLVTEKNVGSVRMLEGEEIQIGFSSLGREDDVTLNGKYRLRS